MRTIAGIIVTIAVAFSIGAASATWVQELRYGNIIKEKDNQYLIDKNKAVEEAKDKSDAALADLRQSRDFYINKIEELRNANKVLSDSLGDGSTGLFVNAECPPTSGVHPTTSSANGDLGNTRGPDGDVGQVDQGRISQAIELSTRSHGDYVELRRRIERYKIVLGQCREYALLAERVCHGGG